MEGEATNFDALGGAVRRLRRAMFATAFAVSVFAGLGFLSPLSPTRISITNYLLRTQDIRLLAIGIGAVVAALLVSERSCRLPRVNAARLVVLSLATVIICYVGRLIAFKSYDLVRDEQMVAFDSFVYSHGRLVWPLPLDWRDEAAALNLAFMYPVDRPVAWISSYLPGNALLHALVGYFGDPGATSPIMAGISVAVLWSIARKIWPDDGDEPVVALLLLLASGQFLVTAMTTWAMTAHLLFNLIWLRLVLSERRSSDVLAIAVGFFATGLHQPLFHPMFVLPFGLLMLARREWSRVVIFGLGYAVIGIFWLSWPHWIEALVAGDVQVGVKNGTDYFDRAGGAILANTSNLSIMAANLLRFATWQNAALLPLMAAAWPIIRRNGFATALAAAVLLPVAVMTFLLPWQGYGFGYRYLHPVIGCAVLLAVYGWKNLREIREKLRPALIATTLVGLIFAFPAQLIFANGFISPSALASRTIEASGVQFALINPSDGVGYANLVYNSPDLKRGPVIIYADLVHNHSRLANRICRGGVRLGMATDEFYRPGSEFFNVPDLHRASRTLARFRKQYEAAGCTITELR